MGLRAMALCGAMCGSLSPFVSAQPVMAPCNVTSTTCMCAGKDLSAMRNKVYHLPVDEVGYG